VPAIAPVSSSSNSTMNFHLVWMALAIMPAYCIKLFWITQDIVFIF
jgi:hypothetical protein